MALKRFREYISQPYEHPGEGKLVRKLGKFASTSIACMRCWLIEIDFFILTFCCLMYFTNYLDRSNLANAYVSGMKEDLGFVGNQFNVINTVFTVGCVFCSLSLGMKLLSNAFFLKEVENM